MRRVVLVMALCVGALVLGAPAATARTEDRVPVAGVLVGADDLDEGVCQARMDDGPVVGCDQLDWSAPFATLRMWSLGMQGRQWWSGDAYLQGTALVDFGWAITTACAGTGCSTTGLLWGTTQWSPDAYPRGGWKGAFVFTITALDTYGFTYSGPLQAEGYGSLKGSRLTLTGTTDATVAPWDGSHTTSGYVLTHSRG